MRNAPREILEIYDLRSIDGMWALMVLMGVLLQSRCWGYVICEKLDGQETQGPIWTAGEELVMPLVVSRESLP